MFVMPTVSLPVLRDTTSDGLGFYIALQFFRRHFTGIRFDGDCDFFHSVASFQVLFFFVFHKENGAMPRLIGVTLVATIFAFAISFCSHTTPNDLCLISIHAPVWGTTEHYCPACGLIGSHIVPNISRCYQKSITGPRLARERSRLIFYFKKK